MRSVNRPFGVLAQHATLLGSFAWWLIVALALCEPSLAHDEADLGREEIERLTSDALTRLDGRVRELESAAAPTELPVLRRRIADAPEVRELVHMKRRSAPIVTDRLEALSESSGVFPDLLACYYTYVIEKSDFRGSLPLLITMLKRASREERCFPDFATQAIKALSRQKGQNIATLRYTESERQEALSQGLQFLDGRVEKLMDSIKQPTALLGGALASGVRSLREVIADDPSIVELTYISRLSSDNVAQLFEGDAESLHGLDYALCGSAYVLEKGQCREAIKSLVAFLENHADAFHYAPSCVARALVTLTGQPDPSPRYLDYDARQLDTVAKQARHYLDRKRK